ncbi:DUF1194 domain-containing protein [Hyphomicrobium sp.]|uniref:DUF1194 domain-containing protein n=1 Tax=Hyphomicrobium sp. TaxID=82 RepID=UPI002E344B44|nr:DUF1194 domain-containing protein [Hyphomicrobium sp.]HEX2840062.1 DUF1194 domain-containing protein [Hyphomicrobium sp.]
MHRPFQTFVLAFACLSFLALSSKADVPVEVDTALVVAVDISDSVNNDRYQLQMEGIARALEDPEVIRAIMSGPRGGIGFAMVEWADISELTIPWRVIRTSEEALETAAIVRRLMQRAGEYTCVSRMLSFVRERVVSGLPLSATRVVLDVSGDGIDNCRDPADTLRERDALVRSGVQINGLPIIVAGENDTVGASAYRAPGFGLGPLNIGPGTQQTTLDAWYTDHLIGGPAGFVIRANGFEDFGRAFRLKFVTEISEASDTNPRCPICALTAGFGKAALAQ